MIFIKHRCNDLSLKYDGEIEIDLWGENGKLFIGHDRDMLRSLPDSFAFNNSTWVHCKNAEAFKIVCFVSESPPCFMHDKEPIAFVHGGFYWTTIPGNVCGLTVFMDTPGAKYTIEEIEMIRRAHGVCSDSPEKWKELFR